MKRYALISVYKKDGLRPFAEALVAKGIELLSTGGTAKFLREAGLAVTDVSELTGQPEILDGRVKTLHPKIHGAILARRDSESHLEQLGSADIPFIDYVVVNLYPFVEKIREIEAQGKQDEASLIELIDIGGPTMIRAAAKNCRFVVPIVDPNDYQVVIDELEQSKEISLETRSHLAGKVFTTTAAYDGQIARYFSLSEKVLNEEGKIRQLAPVETLVLRKEADLRYGENPHQQAALYRPFDASGGDKQQFFNKLQGKEISYNNFLDVHGALRLLSEVSQNGVSTDAGKASAAVIIKHSNPCGAAIRSNPLEAFKAAFSCDPVSAFGGIIALNQELDEQTSEAILENFVEVVLAPKIAPAAGERFRSKKNVRLIQFDLEELRKLSNQPLIAARSFFEDYLLQSVDNRSVTIEEAEVVAGDAPAQELLGDLEFGWRIGKHVKSNTIVIAKNLMAIGVGAGQMSRVDSARIAAERAKIHGFDVEGAVAASDAFLPFPDALVQLYDAGVRALIQPGGSIRDDAVIEKAKELGMTMLFTGTRHFFH